jgi:hypothetical protein
MVIMNEEINQLCKQQHDIIRKIDKERDNDLKAELEIDLLNISQKIKTKREDLLKKFKDEFQITKNKVDEIKPSDKKTINKYYQELIKQYRLTMELAQEISKFKKYMRNNLL